MSYVSAKNESSVPLNPAVAGELLLAYEDERCRLTRRRTRTACLLSVCIVPFYVVSDYLLYPEHLQTLITLRLISVVLGLGVWAAVSRLHRRRAPYVLCQMLCLELALANSGVPVLLLGFSTLYYVGFLIVIFSVALLLPWRASEAAVLGAGLLGIYVGASLLHGSINGWAAFACHISFIGTTIGIALVSMGAGEALRQREFSTRIALQETCDSKSQLVAELADKTAKLESLNQEMEDLLYAASHDLRAPLINVQGFSRELQGAIDHLRSMNGRSPETNAALADIDESLRFILTGVLRMDALITSLLNVSRIATRTNPTQQVDLNGLTRKLAESVRYQLTEKGIALEIDPLPPVTGDPVRLGQLFSNLIDNAIKYMGDRPERRIHVGCTEDHGERHFFVQDTGPGIAKKDQEQVFRLFRRLADGDSPGEGIGLTMVRKIVEKHGGRIWIESAAGAGTTFWFSLPTSPPNADIRGAL